MITASLKKLLLSDVFDITTEVPGAFVEKACSTLLWANANEEGGHAGELQRSNDVPTEETMGHKAGKPPLLQQLLTTTM